MTKAQKEEFAKEGEGVKESIESLRKRLENTEENERAMLVIESILSKETIAKGKLTKEYYSRMNATIGQAASLALPALHAVSFLILLLGSGGINKKIFMSIMQAVSEATYASIIDAKKVKK